MHKNTHTLMQQLFGGHTCRTGHIFSFGLEGVEDGDEPGPHTEEQVKSLDPGPGLTNTHLHHTYCCLVSRAASWKTLGLSFSQSSDTLMAGRGHTPVNSPPCFVLSSSQLHITPRKDTGETRIQHIGPNSYN